MMRLEKEQLMVDPMIAKTVGWFSLNYELAAHYHNVMDDWEQLLDNKSLNESDYLAFLRDHAGFVFNDSCRQLVSISELELGADLRVDFVLANDNSSYGFQYELVELESPHERAFTS